MFFITEKQQKTILNFSLDSLIIAEQYKQQNTKNIKFVTKNRAMSKINQDVENEIIYNIEVSKSDLYDFNDAHIY